MFKQFFKKQGLLCLLMAFPFLGNIYVEKPMKVIAEQVPQQYQTKLASLIIERLEMAELIAEIKWNATQPIDNPEEEAAFMQRILTKAEPLSLDKNLVTEFFAAQIEASKMIHIEKFQAWVVEGVHKHAATSDLDILDKRMQEIDKEILLDLKNIGNKDLFKKQIIKTMQSMGYSRDVIDSATSF